MTAQCIIKHTLLLRIIFQTSSSFGKQGSSFIGNIGTAYIRIPNNLLIPITKVHLIKRKTFARIFSSILQWYQISCVAFPTFMSNTKVTSLRFRTQIQSQISTMVNNRRDKNYCIIHFNSQMLKIACIFLKFY